MTTMINLAINIDIARLQQLIGNEVQHKGKPCHIIEILEDGPSLILQQRTLSSTIQADQHGEAHRKVPTTYTVPILDSDGVAYSSAFSDLNVNHLL